MPVLLAFTVEHAARVTGVSERRIRYWDRTGVLSPSLSNNSKRRHAFNRIYTFQDLVGLRTLGILRDEFALPLQKLRDVGSYLKSWVNAPWSELRFHVIGRGRKADIAFRNPETGLLVSATRPGQGVLFEVAPVAHDVEREVVRLTDRAPDEIGKVVQHRYVLSNSPVLAGTRIPTVAVWEFHKAGYSHEEIIRQYPRLTLVDIRRAIAHEERERQSRTA
jgi:uncharacterized protein (DUF433 family)